MYPEHPLESCNGCDHETLEQQAQAALATSEAAVQEPDARDDEPDDEGAEDQVDVVVLVTRVLLVYIDCSAPGVATPGLVWIKLRLSTVSTTAISSLCSGEQTYRWIRRHIALLNNETLPQIQKRYNMRTVWIYNQPKKTRINLHARTEDPGIFIFLPQNATECTPLHVLPHLVNKSRTKYRPLPQNPHHIYDQTPKANPRRAWPDNSLGRPHKTLSLNSARQSASIPRPTVDSAQGWARGLRTCRAYYTPRSLRG